MRAMERARRNSVKQRLGYESTIHWAIGGSFGREPQRTTERALRQRDSSTTVFIRRVARFRASAGLELHVSLIDHEIVFDGATVFVRAPKRARGARKRAHARSGLRVVLLEGECETSCCKIG